MEETIQEIIQDLIAAIRERGRALREEELNRLILRASRPSQRASRRDSKRPSQASAGVSAPTLQAESSSQAKSTPHVPVQRVGKKMLIPFLRRTRRENPELWQSWVDQGMTAEIEELLFTTVQVKPRRTASGVATITVLTKPWFCTSHCNYCPNDIRMPKSYLSDEPACQRAEQNFFDPYLQVAARLMVLFDMGHPIDKIELIILGSTWDDYDLAYRRWFVHELFRALNDAAEDTSLIQLHKRMDERRAWYRDFGLSADRDELNAASAPLQEAINRGELSYRQAFERLYGFHSVWTSLKKLQSASLSDVCEQHKRNSTAAACRVVGLVMETRPDKVTSAALTELRRMGATKVQIGIQSLFDDILQVATRVSTVDDIARAFALLRGFGFKIHVHYMLNLYGSTPERDIEGYQLLMNDPRFKPDEVKLYPCVLVESAPLKRLYEQGMWKPYSDETLIELLGICVEETQPFVRISRMIRDISTHDIKAGTKINNLRQLVEQRLVKAQKSVQEIRFREVAGQATNRQDLRLRDTCYETLQSCEHFLEYIQKDGHIAGFLRLSLPKEPNLALDTEPAAMIREVHVYGKVISLDRNGAAQLQAQHIGLGRSLIQEACRLASESGFLKMKVISAVGTREYYQRQGFGEPESELGYQSISLVSSTSK